MEITHVNWIYNKCTMPELKRYKVDTVVWHHSESYENTTLEDIERWHMQNFQAQTVGYNYVIYPNKREVYSCRRDKIGAHALNHNSHTIGICIIANLSARELNSDEYSSIREAYKLIKNDYEQLRYIPEKHARHSDLVDTSCPCSLDIQRILTPEETDWEKSVKESYRILAEAGIVSTPEYWHRTLTGLDCRGDFTEKAFMQMADYIRTQKSHQ